MDPQSARNAILDFGIQHAQPCHVDVTKMVGDPTRPATDNLHASPAPECSSRQRAPGVKACGKATAPQRRRCQTKKVPEVPVECCLINNGQKMAGYGHKKTPALIKPVFVGESHPVAQTFVDTPNTDPVVSLFIPFSPAIKDCGVGWRDFVDTNPDSQVAATQLQLLVESLQNRAVGSRSRESVPSLVFFNEETKRHEHKFNVFLELVVRDPTKCVVDTGTDTDMLDADGQCRLGHGNTMTTDDNIAGVRVWVHFADPEYRIGDAVQARIEANMKETQPQRFKEIFDAQQRRGQSQNQGRQPSNRSRARSRVNDRDIAEDGGDGNGNDQNSEQEQQEQQPPENGPQANKRQRYSAYRKNPKQTFLAHEKYMRIDTLNRYAQFIADPYLDWAKEDGEPIAENASHVNGFPDGVFQLSAASDDGGSETMNPAYVFTPDRSCQYAELEGACALQCDPASYRSGACQGNGDDAADSDDEFVQVAAANSLDALNLNFSSSDNEGARSSGLQFPIPALVWQLRPDQFRAEMLWRTRFPWHQSRFSIEARQFRSKWRVQPRNQFGRAPVSSMHDAWESAAQEAVDGAAVTAGDSHSRRRVDTAAARARSQHLRAHFAEARWSTGSDAVMDDITDRRHNDDMRRLTTAMSRRMEYLVDLMPPEYELRTNTELATDYRALRRVFAEEAVRELQGTLDIAHDISAPGKAMLRWYYREGLLHLSAWVPTVDLEGSRYISMHATEMMFMEFFLMISQVHLAQSEFVYASFDAYRDDPALHYNILTTGAPGSSKSELIINLVMILIVDTVRNSTGMSAKAMTAGHNSNDMIRVMEEAMSTITMPEHKLSGPKKEQAEMLKAILTSMMAEYEVLELVEDPNTGQKSRFLVKVRSEQRCVIFTATNDAVVQMMAMVTRFRVMPTRVVERPNKQVVDLMGHKKDEFLRARGYMHRKQFLNFIAWKMIQVNALPTPSVELGTFYALQGMQTLHRKGYSVFPRVRTFERMKIMGALETVAAAIDYVFFSEASPLLERDEATGRIRFKRFEMRQLLHIAPLLCQREDCAIKVFTQLMNEFTNSNEYALLQWIAQTQCRYATNRQPEDQQRRERDQQGREHIVEPIYRRVESGTSDTTQQTPGAAFQYTGMMGGGYNNGVGGSGVAAEDRNYLMITGMNLQDLAKHVIRHCRAFRQAQNTVLAMLKDLERRAITTDNYRPPGAPRGQRRRKRIDAVVVADHQQKSQRRVYIAVELLRHKPDELVRQVVEQSFQHEFTRERKVVLGLQNRDTPWLLQSFDLKRVPGRRLRRPNAAYMSREVYELINHRIEGIDDGDSDPLNSSETAQIAKQVSPDIQDQFRTTAQLVTEITEDAEEFFCKRFWRRSHVIGPDEFAEYYPRRLDERIRELRGYYSATNENPPTLEHSRGAGHRVEGAAEWRNGRTPESREYPEFFARQAAADMTRIRDQMAPPDAAQPDRDVDLAAETRRRFDEYATEEMREARAAEEAQEATLRDQQSPAHPMPSFEDDGSPSPSPVAAPSDLAQTASLRRKRDRPGVTPPVPPTRTNGW